MMNKKILFAMLTVMALLLASVAFAEEASTVQVGDHFTFGVYEQDNDLTNGQEPIEWRVLKIEGNEALCITEYALDSVCYSTARGYARWRTATLRDWLSNDFYNAAFSDTEKQAIITKEIINWREKPTTDPVILLDTDQAKRLFSSHDDRQCIPTAYAVAQGGYISREGTCWWWLRSPGGSSRYAAGVFSSGAVDHYGDGVFGAHDMVRPAMWIELGPTG